MLIEIVIEIGPKIDSWVGWPRRSCVEVERRPGSEVASRELAVCVWGVVWSP